MDTREVGYKLLLIERNPDDIFLFNRALGRSAVAMRICFEVKDGGEALHYLHGRGLYADRNRYPFPDMVVANLPLQGPPEREFLQELNGAFPDLNLVVLSKGESPADETMLRECGCRHIFHKPPNPKDLTHILQNLQAELDIARARPHS